jgi:flagellar motor switch protein FliN/FliY
MAVEQVSAPAIEELQAGSGREFPGGRLTLRDLYKVPFTITAELGQTQMKVRDVLALKVGSLVVLDKYAGQLADLRVNGIPMAKGEVVVIGDSINVRIADTATPEDQAAGG